MNLTSSFINPETKRLRSGWRALVFVVIVALPSLLAPLFLSPASGPQGTVFEVSGMMILAYVFLIAWVVFVSWFCLRLLESLPLGALGFAWHVGWWRDAAKGVGVGAVMVASVVALQWIGGGTQVQWNPAFTGAHIGEFVLATLLLVLAAAFEELAYRGYAFQTLLRGAPAIVPITLLSLFFGLGHWENPGRTIFSTLNTVLAGVWLSVAYLKTRSLWFPTALHFTWNFALGPVFGLPVSGLLIPRQPLWVSTSGNPMWLTGGAYGSEGGIAATAVLLIATALIYQTRWLMVSAEIKSAWQPKPADDAPTKLHLIE